jgi:hypothetical protein
MTKSEDLESLLVCSNELGAIERTALEPEGEIECMPRQPVFSASSEPLSFHCLRRGILSGYV